MPGHADKVAGWRQPTVPRARENITHIRAWIQAHGCVWYFVDRVCMLRESADNLWTVLCAVVQLKASAGLDLVVVRGFSRPASHNYNWLKQGAPWLMCHTTPTDPPRVDASGSTQNTWSSAGGASAIYSSGAMQILILHRSSCKGKQSVGSIRSISSKGHFHRGKKWRHGETRSETDDCELTGV